MFGWIGTSIPVSKNLSFTLAFFTGLELSSKTFTSILPLLLGVIASISIKMSSFAASTSSITS